MSAGKLNLKERYNRGIVRRFNLLWACRRALLVQPVWNYCSQDKSIFVWLLFCPSNSCSWRCLERMCCSSIVLAADQNDEMPSLCLIYTFQAFCSPWTLKSALLQAHIPAVSMIVQWAGSSDDNMAAGPAHGSTFFIFYFFWTCNVELCFVCTNRRRVWKLHLNAYKSSWVEDAGTAASETWDDHKGWD